MAHSPHIDVASLPTGWRLTSGEGAVFNALLAEDAVSRASISSAAGVTEGSVGVLIRRIRTKLSSHGIEIETVAGKGWRLIGRETWRTALSAITN